MARRARTHLLDRTHRVGDDREKILAGPDTVLEILGEKKTWGRRSGEHGSRVESGVGSGFDMFDDFDEVVEEAVDDTKTSKREGLSGLAREPFLHLSKQEEVRLRCLQYIAADFKLYSHQHSCNNNHLHARSTYMLKTSSLDTYSK